MDALIKLRKKISNQSMQERDLTGQTHRYYSIRHQLRVVPEIHDGKYLETCARKAPTLVERAINHISAAQIESADQVGEKEI